jgi:uncharacterized membrane protein YqgA involved in biofilm formation
VGTYIIKGVSESLQNTIVEGISLAVVVVGLKMAWASPDIVVAIIALAIGGLLGETLSIDSRLNSGARKLEERFAPGGSARFARGLVTASLIYCAGAMAITGSLENGLTGKYDTLLAKSALDCIMSIVLASTLGIGVAFSAIPVFMYQGTIALLAGVLQPVLAPEVVAQMGALGGMLVLAISLNLMGATKIKVANLLPAILVGGLLMIGKAII